MDRREFAVLLPALLAGSVGADRALCQSASLPVLESGVYQPTPAKAGSTFDCYRTSPSARAERVAEKYLSWAQANSKLPPL